MPSRLRVPSLVGLLVSPKNRSTQQLSWAGPPPATGVSFDGHRKTARVGYDCWQELELWEELDREQERKAGEQGLNKDEQSKSGNLGNLRFLLQSKDRIVHTGAGWFLLSHACP